MQKDGFYRFVFILQKPNRTLLILPDNMAVGEGICLQSSILIYFILSMGK